MSKRSKMENCFAWWPSLKPYNFWWPGNTTWPESYVTRRLGDPVRSLIRNLARFGNFRYCFSYSEANTSCSRQPFKETLFKCREWINNSSSLSGSRYWNRVSGSGWVTRWSGRKHDLNVPLQLWWWHWSYRYVTMKTPGSLILNCARHIGSLIHIE